MRPITLGLLLLASSVALPHAASAGPSAQAIVTLGQLPLPPGAAPQREPRVMLVPGSTVYVATGAWDYDLFRYGVYWYAFADGDWYRARTHRGPFTAVIARYVPTAVVNVPPKYWRQPHGRKPAKPRGEYVAAREAAERER